MVSGDQVVAEQVRALSPLAECVVVKHALSNQAADCLAPARARELIAAGAERAVRAARNGVFQPYRTVPAPYLFDVELKSAMNEAMRNNLKAQRDFEIVSDGHVRVTAPDMDLGFRRVAYLGYANRAGVLKY
jgi:D-aminopeptidase